MLQELTVKEFLEELASRKPTPGGGSAAALSGAIAAALVSMAAKISGDEKIAEKSERLMGVLIGLIDRDARAFERVIREKSSQESLKEATEVPLQTARYAIEVLEIAAVLAQSCNPKVDVGVAVKLAHASFESALSIVGDNLASIEDEEYKKKILG